MTAAELKALPANEAGQLPALPRALWADAQGDWQTAHELAQEVETPQGSWVHAFLHRREKDLANAAYWYRRAGKPVCTTSLDEEWHAIASALL